MSSPDNPQFESLPPVSTEPQGPVMSLDPSAVAPVSPSDIPAQSLPLSPAAPPRDPVWSGWDVLLIAAVTLLTIFVAGMFLAIGTHILWPHKNLNAVAPLVALAAQFIAYMAVAICMIMLIEGKYHVDFWKAIRWKWPRGGWRMFALGVLLLLSINIVAHFLPMPKSTPFDQFFASRRDAYLIAVFAVTLGPFMEELFFRGLLYPVLVRRLGMFWGIVLTALPFGLMHMFQYGYAWGVVLLIFIMGIVCTLVRALTGSVAASFLVHVGYNMTEMVALIAATDGFRHMEKAMLLFR